MYIYVRMHQEPLATPSRVSRVAIKKVTMVLKFRCYGIRLNHKIPTGVLDWVQWLQSGLAYVIYICSWLGWLTTLHLHTHLCVAVGWHVKTRAKPWHVACVGLEARNRGQWHCYESHQEVLVVRMVAFRTNVTPVCLYALFKACNHRNHTTCLVAAYLCI